MIMKGKEGSVLGFDAMIDLRDSGAIPNQVYNRSSRNNQDNSVTGWWEDVEKPILIVDVIRSSDLKERSFYILV